MITKHSNLALAHSRTSFVDEPFLYRQADACRSPIVSLMIAQCVSTRRKPDADAFRLMENIEEEVHGGLTPSRRRVTKKQGLLKIQQPL